MERADDRSMVEKLFKLVNLIVERNDYQAKRE